MRVKALMLSIALVMLVVASSSTMAETPKVVALREAVVVGKALVIGVDRVDRTLGILTPDGDAVAVEVGYEVRNFDEIQVGDEITVEYYASVAVYVTRMGDGPEETAGLMTARAGEGEKPAAIAVETVDVSAVIHAINRTERSLLLKKYDGSKVKVFVDDSHEIYNTLREGDQVHVRYTEAIAVSVR